MAFVLADRVRESSTTNGTGSLTLNGAVAGFQSFAAAMSTGDTCWYAISDGTNWETGVGTFTSPSTLARTSVFESSNSDTLVAFPAGTKDVFVTVPASKAAGLQDATASVKGIVLLASQAEATAGTDTAKAVTPATMEGRVSPAVLSKSANYTVVAADKGALIECTASLTLALTAAATLGNGFNFYVRQTVNGGIATLDPNSAELIDGLATANGYIGDGVFKVWCDGSSFRTSRCRGPILISKTIVGSAVASIDMEAGFGDAELFGMQFRISAITAAATGQLRFRVKKGGAYQTSGYAGRSVRYSGGSTVVNTPTDSIYSDNHDTALSAQINLDGINSSTVLEQLAYINAMASDITNGDSQSLVVSYCTSPASALQGARLNFSSGNITGGSVRQYGVRN